jgi:hypothetical protein
MVTILARRVGAGLRERLKNWHEARRKAKNTIDSIQKSLTTIYAPEE